MFLNNLCPCCLLTCPCVSGSGDWCWSVSESQPTCVTSSLLAAPGAGVSGGGAAAVAARYKVSHQLPVSVWARREESVVLFEFCKTM